MNLLATAGMRYAEGLHGRPAIDHLYDTIRSGIRAHGFPVGEVCTTCGSEEEGIWTWINLNDLLGKTFDGGSEPVGIVEVGGSSLQLTFPTDEDPDVVPHVHRVALNGRRLLRAVPSRRAGETMLSWTRGYLLARHSGG